MNDELVRMEQERRNGRLILHLHGEVDLSNVEHLGRQIDLAATGSAHVVIDLSEIEYIDSQGLRLLKRLSNRFSDEGTTFQVIAPPGTFARGVLEMTLLNEALEVHDGPTE